MECPLCTRHRASEGDQCQTDVLINDRACNRTSEQDRAGRLCPQWVWRESTGSAPTPPPSTAPCCYSRAMSHMWQSGITRWLPKYFLFHISSRTDLMLCWMLQYMVLNSFYDPVFQSSNILKASLSIHMRNQENIILLIKKIYSIHHSNFFIYNNI